MKRTFGMWAGLLALGLAGVVACSSSDGGGSSPSPDGGDIDASSLTDGGPGSSTDAAAGDATTDAPTGDAGAGLTPCATTGKEALVAMSPCWTFTPAEAGAASTGANAGDSEFALEPSGTPKGGLVVQFNGSLGSPAGQIADPTKNLYNAVAQAGFHVIGIAYRSTEIVGAICNDAACYSLYRKSIVTGVYQAGAPASVADITLDEGIVARIDAAVRLLAKSRPGAGWDQFIANAAATDASQRLAWPKIIGSGHSQGGGMAAYLGLTFPLRQVVQLSSTCDAVGSTPATWTDASSPWLTSPATLFVGFAAPTTFVGGTPTSGDKICPYHLAVWQNMGMATANQHDDAAICGAKGDTHGESITCVDNFPRWGGLYQ